MSAIYSFGPREVGNVVLLKGIQTISVIKKNKTSPIRKSVYLSWTRICSWIPYRSAIEHPRHIATWGPRVYRWTIWRLGSGKQRHQVVTFWIAAPTLSLFLFQARLNTFFSLLSRCMQGGSHNRKTCGSLYILMYCQSEASAQLATQHIWPKKKKIHSSIAERKTCSFPWCDDTFF